jgi:hypothetical protein
MSAGNATGAEAYAAVGGGGGAMLGSQGHVVAVMGNAYQRLEDWLARRWGSSVYLLYSYTRHVQILTARTSGSRTGWQGGPAPQFTCCTRTHVQIMATRTSASRTGAAVNPKFACCTRTKVPILTQTAVLQAELTPTHSDSCAAQGAGSRAARPGWLL